MKRGSAFFIIGAVIGLGVSVTLDATGLHWLTWPIAGLFALAALAITVTMRKRS
jgi:hypothetical protein